VGRISPTGDITVFPFGAGGDRGLQDISPGVSDVVWVSETNVAAVGRVASDGSWKEFPLNFPRSNSFRITLGSDGRMWFTAESKNRVGRIVLQRPPP
jgi:virginiamycin B lyase